MPENPQDEEILAIAREIRSYLANHPNAADSLEGIIKWWLARQRCEYALDMVQRAVDYLVAAGTVTRGSTVTGKILYSTTVAKSNEEP